MHVRGGEFVADEVEDLMDQDSLVERPAGRSSSYTQDRQAVPDLRLRHQARPAHRASASARTRRRVRVRLRRDAGRRARRAAGPIPRRPASGLFEREPLKYLCNVNVLTTGFDAPNIDCVALLRPTMSPGLYYQMVGRGFRLHPGKKNCLVLDFGGNVLRHGPVDQITVKERDRGGNGEAPAKECPECHSVIAAGYATCPDCGYEFPPPERPTHDAEAPRRRAYSRAR